MRFPCITKLFRCFFLLLCIQAIHAGDTTLDLLKIEGVYDIDVSYVHLDGKKDSRLDRLVIYRNKGENFTIALAMSIIDVPFIVFKSTSYECDEGQIMLRGEGELENGIYGEIKLTLSRSTYEVKGVMTDSVANGYKQFTGKALYNLSMCLYRDGDLEFPNIKELVGEYRDEEGNLLLIRSYTSGILSVVFQKKLPTGDFVDIKYANGVYDQEYGIVELPWKLTYDAGRSLEGKTNVTYRIDDAGKPYLKFFSINTSGQNNSKIRKFYFSRKLLELPDY